MSKIVKKKGKVSMAFRVDPEWLRKKTYVPDGVRIVFTGYYPIEFIKLGLLGESGLDMFFRGFPFIFTRKTAEMLIKKGFAKKLTRGTPKLQNC